MSNSAVAFRTVCKCGTTHLTVGYPTTTPGLYVNEADYCPSERRAIKGARWAITHRTTGLAFPWRFRNPDDAFTLAAYASSVDVTWTDLNPGITDEVRTALAAEAGLLGAVGVGPRSLDWTPPAMREEVNR